MIIDRNTLLFFDSSCIIAAAGSPGGGSAFLLSLCARGYLTAAISQPVLLEAQSNIQAKLGDEAAQRFYNLLAIIPFILAPIPQSRKIHQTYLDKGINQKDIHVILAAVEVRAPFLLTLDKRFTHETNNAQIGIIALSPGDFIKTVLPQHTAYHRKES